jgi:hypothetical protein
MTIEQIDPVTFNIVCASLPSIVNGYFEKEELLINNGLQAFRPALRFMEDFTTSQEELDEYKRFLTESRKSRVGGGSYDAEWFCKLTNEAKAKFKRTGDWLDSIPTQFERHLAEMESSDFAKLHFMKQPYKDETDRIWKQDVKRFASEQWHGLDFDKDADRKKLYIDIFKNWEKKLGFTLDKQLSTSRKPVMTKPFVAPWKLGFVIDTVHFYRPVESDRICHQGGVTYTTKSSPTLETYFGLLHDKVKSISKIQQGESLLFKFNDYYPINLLDNSAQLYLKFFDLEELDAAINIHLTLYELMQEEFETALFKGLS